MSPSSPTSAALVALALVSACQDDLPELRYETEHLRIGTEFDEPLCRGNLDHLERVVTSLEDQLSTRVDDPIEVYLWDPLRVVNPGWCPHDYNLGCFSEGSVFSGPIAVDHELVHAVVATLGNPAPFWAEGVAEALQSDRTLFGSSAPVDNLDLDTPQLSYLGAGHFSRWLFETHGAESYNRLLRASGGARQAFEQTYDMSFEDAQAQFFVEAPYSYGARISCEHPELTQTGDLSWYEVFDVDCDNADVHSTIRSMGAFRVLTITERGHYAFSTSGETGYIARCDDEDLELPSLAGDPALGDLPPTTDGFIFQYGRAFDGAGAVTVYELAPGRYEVAAGHQGFDPRAADLDVWATSGPVPQTPGTP